MRFLRRFLLTGYELLYALIKPMLFQLDAMQAHALVMRLLTVADSSSLLCGLARLVNLLTFRAEPGIVGDVRLNRPYIMAAGFVKGHGFIREDEALLAVRQGVNIMPGWRSIPALTGAVEFGSFTRYPLTGNPGVVMWRDVRARSTQNRVGLKNPGAVAAAQFLYWHRGHLPRIYGINIAVSPGVHDPDREERDVLESLAAFLDRRVIPAWFTLNISCPNTEDDPQGNQTEQKTRRLCQAVRDYLHQSDYDVPLWVKISPDLAPEQIVVLMRVFEQTGVRAVIATNTLGQPVPGQESVRAGVGGQRLHEAALSIAEQCYREKVQHGYTVDVIGCGGVLDAVSHVRYRVRGIQVVQYWSALVYRGPLAAALIHESIS